MSWCPTWTRPKLTDPAPASLIDKGIKALRDYQEEIRKEAGRVYAENVKHRTDALARFNLGDNVLSMAYVKNAVRGEVLYSVIVRAIDEANNDVMYLEAMKIDRKRKDVIKGMKEMHKDFIQDGSRDWDLEQGLEDPAAIDAKKLADRVMNPKSIAEMKGEAGSTGLENQITWDDVKQKLSEARDNPSMLNADYLFVSHAPEATTLTKEAVEDLAVTQDGAGRPDAVAPFESTESVYVNHAPLVRDEEAPPQPVVEPNHDTKDISVASESETDATHVD
jgi:hypothetical protein